MERIFYSVEDSPKFVTPGRAVKLMSALLQRQSTPKNIRGVEIDADQKQKYSNRKDKILRMEIEIEEPTYDQDGQLIVTDQNSDYAAHLDGVFMAHLLDEEYLDSQEWIDPDGNGSPRPVLDGEDLQADIKKHLNLDF